MTTGWNGQGMGRRAALLGVAGWGLLLGACAVVSPGPRTVEISEVRLAEMISRHFPVDTRYLEWFDVSLAQPRIRLMPAENRIATQMDYTLGTALTGGRALRGGLELSYGLRFEPGDATVRLADVRVERFDLPGVPASQAGRVNRLGSAMAESVLQDAVVHRLRPDELKHLDGWGYQPGLFKVVPGAVQLTLNPVRPVPPR